MIEFATDSQPIISESSEVIFDLLKCEEIDEFAYIDT